MKVKDLLEKLKDADPEAEIVRRTNSGYDYLPKYWKSSDLKSDRQVVERDKSGNIVEIRQNSYWTRHEGGSVQSELVYYIG